MHDAQFDILAGRAGQPDQPRRLLLEEADSDPATRWTVAFPAVWEAKLRRWDDAGIAAGQRLHSPAFRVALLPVGVVNSVEALFALPVALLAGGLAPVGAAASVAALALLCGVTSQLPKRFLWRTRPWAQGRALGHETDSTSSFPSRAVLCAVVWPYALLAAFARTRFLWQLWFQVGWVLWLSLTSLGRVCLGAHYPSDCAAGVVLGAAICVLHAWLLPQSAEQLPCAACPVPPLSGLAAAAAAPAPMLAAGFGAVTLLLVAACSMPPVYFWRKFHSCLGTAMPCLFFAAGFPQCAAAPPGSWTVCRSPRGWPALLCASVPLPLAVIALAYALRHRPVAACALLYGVVYGALVALRVGPAVGHPG